MSMRPRCRQSFLAPLLGLLAIGLILVPAARAHEVRPAYLQIDEIGPGRYQLLWRIPVVSGMPLPVVLQLPEGMRYLAPPTRQELPDSVVERALIDEDGGR